MTSDLVLSVLHCEARRIIREWPKLGSWIPGHGIVSVDGVAHARAAAALRGVNARIAERRLIIGGQLSPIGGI